MPFLSNLSMVTGASHKIRWILSYYLEHHLSVDIPGRAIKASDGVTIGYLETVRLQHGRIFIRGWSLAHTVRFRSGMFESVKHPAIERKDVAEVLGCIPDVGFETSLPEGEGSISLFTEWKGEPVELEIALPGAAALRRERRRLTGRFARQMLRLMPEIVRGTLSRDPLLRGRVKTALGLDGSVDTGEIDARYFAAREPSGSAASGVTIIMPVYNAFELVQEAFGRVLRNTEVPWRLIIIEDCSTDTRVRPWLRETLAETRAEIELIENDVNLGFIGSVNAGFERALEHGDPVVLLNSDALLPPGWASRLLAPLQADPNVASVTPLSNDAEIFSIPVICQRKDLAEGQGEAIDAVASRLGLPDQSVEAPTGVGFCMAMSPRFLELVPHFDTGLGRGYGEEVDWCQKTAALGGKHVTASNLFVEHRGGESFGSAVKQQLVANNNAIITQRYPDYDASVQRFILRDPLLTPRIVLALAFLGSRQDREEVPVYIAHSMGGGAENYLQHRIESRDLGEAVVLRMGGAYRCQIEVVTPNGTVKAGTDDLSLVRRLIQILQRRRIIYSCAVGDPDPSSVPDFLLELADSGPLEVLFHDYFPISPSYTLLDADQVYRGTPLPQQKDPAHCVRRPNGEQVTLEQWQEKWGWVMAASQRVVVFSSDSKKHVERVYPQVADRIVMRPHEIPHELPRILPPESRRLVIGVLGNIGAQKGAAVVQALSHRLVGDRHLDLVVLGRIDPAFPLAPRVRVHGGYQPADIPTLVKDYQIGAWLIPSIWPETFSYTTQECLSTGLPVLAFDLGAQGDAVRHAPNGHVVVLPREFTPAEQLANAIISTVQAQIMPAAIHRAS